MATRHDKRRPIRNALLKWQLLQDQKRIAEAKHRLVRMAVPSPASPLVLDHSYDRRPTVRPGQHHDPEEDALMTLIMEREERESVASNQHFKRSSKMHKNPSVLPPLRRPEGSKPPPNTPLKNVTLRPTGQKLNAAGDFYSPVRPREALNSSSSEFRQSLVFSRIKAPTPKQLIGRTSPKNPFKYDQMKTPDRWRTTAMRSNQEELNESAMKRWEDEDARQADRLLEKAARDGDDEALWNDLFYGTKAARAKTNQLPEQPVVYSASSFPEVFSRSRSNSHDSVYYQDDSILKSNQLANDLVAGDDKNYDGSNGGDKDNFSSNVAASDPLVLQFNLSDVEIPRWSVIMVVICLVLGTGGFFMEELLAFVGLFSSHVPFTRGEQERMRDRVKALQQDLQGFQLSTSKIEVNSQIALTELRQHMDRMRLDREKHQDILANEMQELRRHMLHVTHELVEKERESIQNQLEGLMKVQAVNEMEIPSNVINEVKLEKTQPELEAGSKFATDKSMKDLESIEAKRQHQIDDEETHLEVSNTTPTLEQVEEPTEAVAGSSMQSSHQTNNVQVPIETPREVDQVLSVAESHIEEIEIAAVHGGNISRSSIVQKTTSLKSGMSWDGILLLIGIMFLAACIVLRVYNINRRKKWFEQRRRRRHQRAWLLAQRRARELAEAQDDSDEWDGEKAEETPIQDNEDDSKQELELQSSDYEDNNQSEQGLSSPPAVYRMATKSTRRSPVRLRQRNKVLAAYTG
eukprot:jgi/Phyca11/120515/e_gw1.41.388.1